MYVFCIEVLIHMSKFCLNLQLFFTPDIHEHTKTIFIYFFSRYITNLLCKMIFGISKYINKLCLIESELNTPK